MSETALKVEELINAGVPTAIEGYFRKLQNQERELPKKLFAAVLKKSFSLQKFKTNGSSISISTFEAKMQYTNGLGPKKRGRPLGSFKRIPVPSITSLQENLPLVRITKLRPKHLRILNLYSQGTLTLKEIALICDVTTATIGNVIHSVVGEQFLSNVASGKLKEVRNLIEPAIDVVRKTLVGADMVVAQRSALAILKSEGGIKDVRQHEVTGRDGRPIEIVETKKKLLKMGGVSPEAIENAVFKEIVD